jgi:hypothetical protein
MNISVNNIGEVRAHDDNTTSTDVADITQCFDDTMMGDTGCSIQTGSIKEF